MKHWSVGARLLSCASVLALMGGVVDGASAHGDDCKSITHPTTINSDRKCVRVPKTVNGNVTNNATIGKKHGYGHGWGHDDRKSPFIIGGGGRITGTLVNNGEIIGGEQGYGALTLGKNADVAGGIYNKGAIVSKDGNGINLGYYEYGRYGGPQRAALTGNIVNSGLIAGDDYGVAALYGTMSGTLINKNYGVIVGGDAGVYVADSFTSWTGGIENAGLIKGGFAGIQIGDFDAHDWGGEHYSYSYGGEGVVFSGGITNLAGGAIISKSGPSIAVGGESFSGGIANDGLITQYAGHGGEYGGYGYGDASPYKGVGIVFTAPTVAGGVSNGANGEIYGTKGPAIWITDKTETFSGGITNHGVIAGADDGIRIESATFTGGLLNGETGAIFAIKGDAITATSAWTGDFQNDGLILGARNGFAYDGSTFDGNVLNTGIIGGGKTGVTMAGDALNGAFANSGLIGGGKTGVSLDFTTMAGGFTNSGTITGLWGDGVALRVDTLGTADARADVVNTATGVIEGGETGFLLDAGTVYGDFINDGVIYGAGENTGAHIIAGAFNGDITNNKDIGSPHDALVVEIETFNGAFTNTGAIAGGGNGAVFTLGTMSGGFANSGSITGTYGDGLSITVDTLGTAEARADIVNESTGVITGGDTGFLLNAGTVYGDFINDGVIHGGGENTGAHIIAGAFNGDITNNESITSPYDAFVAEIEVFNGSFANTDTIEGGVNGAVFNLGSMSGGFTNSGSITGTYGDGLAIFVDTLGAAEDRADIVNTSTGVITGGDTGFLLNAGTVYGDFVNDGLIYGGGADTGAHIIAGTFNGDITNNESITSPYDAFVAEIETFNGSFANTDTIEGGVNGAVFDLGSMSGDFSNSGSITGTYGNGVDISVYDWGSSEVPVAILNSGSGVIEGGVTGFKLVAGTVHGSFTNEGSVTGGVNGATFNIETFDAPFANSGTISGGANGVVMALGSASGGFENSGSITGTSGNGVDILVTNWGSSEARADIVNTATGTIIGGDDGLVVNLVTFHGDVTNDGSIDGGATGVLLSGGLFDGAFENTGEINGGSTGVAMTLETVTGPFTNSGSIDGASNDGVAINVGTWGSAEARAGIVNTSTGVINGADTGFLLDVGTMHGDFINDGVIHGEGSDTGLHIIAGTFNGDIVNNESITSPYDAFVAEIATFNGSFANTDTIEGGVNGAVFDLGSMSGGFTNSGSITGETGNGVDISVYNWGSSEAPVAILNSESGVIEGGVTGFKLVAGTVHGSFTNEGSVTGGVNGATFNIETFDAPFANSGTISGGANGVVMALGSASGGFENSGSITGTSGNGVDILVTNWGSSEVPANFVNTAEGTIGGGDDGLVVQLVTFHGDVTNNASIEGGDTGVLLAGGLFDGAFENTGEITGGSTGVAMSLETVTGPFTNSGSIDGAGNDGVAINVGAWGSAEARAGIVNTSTGVINGADTGFLLNVGTMHGDFVNDGVIHGEGSDTGLHIIAGTFNGAITNNDLIDAPSNAMHLEIGTLNGEVVNTGTIAATESGGVAVALAIGNGTTFTNTGGGVILGDVVFGGEAAYAFVAEDGLIEGDLIGEGNDDTITVQNGAHAFLSGAAANFQSFTVASGGLALMGAHFEGDGAGTGYGFTNVGNLNVNNGGTLYIDKSTTLVVANNYTQAAGGTVEFYLGAPGGAGFSSLTGNVVAGDEDYGQILVQGSVTLDGAVVGFLDPAYAAANPGLNQVFYDDVIIAEGGIVGDFNTLGLIADSSLFEMIQVVDGNAVDITVARTALDTVAGVVVNIGGPFDAMVSDRSNGIGSGSCSLAGEGWCFNRFAANEPGASQVMTDATPDDPFAWLRTGVRKVGETAVWGRAVGAWGNTDGHAGTKGTEFDVAGAIVGVDHVFTPVFMAGIAGQWTTTDVDFRGRPDHAEVENFEAGAYLSWGDTRLYLNANASVIWHDIEVARFSPSTQALGKYDGTTLSAFAEVGKTFETAEGFRIQPFLSLSYSHLETDAYSEIGTGTLLDVSDSEFDSLKSTIGIRLAYPIPLESGRRVVPEARVGWTHEYMDDQAAFLASVQGQPDPPSIVRGEKFSRDTLVVGGGVTVPLSASSALFVDYDAGLNPDITTHTVSAGLRITW